STSKWLAARTQRYRALLRGWQCDVLVVPMQVEESAFDHATRNLMSGDIASALAATHPCVVDPYVAELALGEGLRRYDTPSVHARAKATGAKSIVGSPAGHDQDGRMRVTLRVASLPSGKSTEEPRLVARKSFEDLVYDDAVSPYDALHKNLSRMLE